ncbi:hypothetical protein ACH4ND_26400 [Streptomyces sp. NPDC017179]
MSCGSEVRQLLRILLPKVPAGLRSARPVGEPSEVDDELCPNRRLWAWV